MLYHTAYPPFFAQLVQREQYLEANSLLSTTRSASFIAGPPLAGALVSVLTAPLALVVDVCSFLVSSLLISRVDIDEPIATQPTRRPTANGSGSGCATCTITRSCGRRWRAPRP